LFVVVCGWVIILGDMSNHWDRNSNDAVKILFPYLLVSIGVYSLIVTLRMTTGIVRERERDTLDSLLMLPMSNSELLRAKVKAGLVRGSFWLLPFGFAFGVLMFIGERFA